MEKYKLERIVNNLKQSSIAIGNKMIIPTISFAMGFGAGKLGKAFSHPEIVAVPAAMDLTMGVIGKNHIIPYLFYGTGVALNYLPEIYQALQNYQNIIS